MTLMQAVVLYKGSGYQGHKRSMRCEDSISLCFFLFNKVVLAYIEQLEYAQCMFGKLI